MMKVTFYLFTAFLLFLPILLEAKRIQEEIVKSEDKEILQAISINFPNRCRKGYALKHGKCRRKLELNFNPFNFFDFA